MPENISIINENISEIVILQENNFTINESTIQFSAKLGQPVKWKKTLKIDGENNKTLNSLEVTLPKTAGEVSVRKIFENESVEELKVNVKNEKIISETEPIISITGQSIKNEHKNNIFRFFRSFFSLVGRVIDIGENENAVLVSIQEELEDNDEIEIEYYTEAPYSEENTLSESHKIVNVVGSEEVHYENILAFSNLSKEVSSKDEIKLNWIKNDSKTLIDFESFDKDNNGKLDYIEWIVPSLSNQTYEIILITKAQHLDSNKNYAVLSSEDWINWKKEDPANIKKTSTILELTTNHFTYFALVETDTNWNIKTNVVIPPVDNWNDDANNDTVEDTTKSYNSWWGGSSPSKDKCEFWDYSPSYYDNTCWTDPDEKIATMWVKTSESFRLEQALEEVRKNEEFKADIFENTFKDVEKAKKEREKISKPEFNKIRKDSRLLINQLMDHLQRKRFRELDKVTLRIKSNDKYSEIIILEDNAFIIDDIKRRDIVGLAKINKDGSLGEVNKSSAKELEENLDKKKIEKNVFVKEALFKSLKELFGKDMEILIGY